jgi:hypothetical protein
MAFGEYRNILSPVAFLGELLVEDLGAGVEAVEAEVLVAVLAAVPAEKAASALAAEKAASALAESMKALFLSATRLQLHLVRNTQQGAPLVEDLLSAVETRVVEALAEVAVVKAALAEPLKAVPPSATRLRSHMVKEVPAAAVSAEGLSPLVTP